MKKPWATPPTSCGACDVACHRICSCEFNSQVFFGFGVCCYGGCRNPLHAISASAEFLAEAIDPSDPAHEDVQAIVAGSQQMHRLVNDVLGECLALRVVRQRPQQRHVCARACAVQTGVNCAPANCP